MKKAILIALLTIMIGANAQITQLVIGDKVSDMKFTALNYKSPYLKLSDFKGKNIIFDFWSKRCSNCIEGFPKMDSLQKLFGKDLQVILINSHPSYHSKNEVKQFIDSWKRRTNHTLDLPMVVEDSSAYYTFRYNGLPHYVWIGIDGRIKAITEQREVTTANVAQFVKQGDILLPQKQDFLMDRLMDLGSKTNVEEGSARHLLFRKGEIPGYKPIDEKRWYGRYEQMGINGFAIRNVTIDKLYRCILQQNDSLSDEAFNLSCRIINETKNPKELYSYDRSFPREEVKNSHELYRRALEDLNYVSGCYGRFEMRTVYCYVLSDTLGTPVRGKQDIVKQKIYTRTLDEIARIVSAETNQGIIMINESTYSGKINMPESVLFDDMDKLRATLAPYRVTIKPTNRRIKMFVISEK